MNNICYTIKLHELCNYWCLFCFQKHENRANAEIKDRLVVFNLILNAYKKWYKSIEFTWGEPLLSKNIFIYLKFSKKIGFKNILIKTNWYLFWDLNFVNNCILSWMTSCHISIHHYISKKHDFIVSKEWAFFETLKWIRYLKTKRLHLWLQIVLNKNNYKDIKDIILFFLNEWILDFVILFQEIEWEVYNNLNDLLISYNEVIPYLLDTLSLFNGISWKYIKILNFPYCLFPLIYHKYIISEINLTVNIEEWDIKYINRKRNSNLALNKCNKCDFFKKCSLVDINYLNFYWEEEFWNKILSSNYKNEFNIIDIYIKSIVNWIFYSNINDYIDYVISKFSFSEFYLYFLITDQNNTLFEVFKDNIIFDVTSSINKLHNIGIIKLI